MRGLHVWAGIAIALLVVVLLGWLLLSPGWAKTLVEETVRVQLGREIEFKGGAHLSLSPLSIRLDDAILKGLAGDDASFITAKSVRIPVSITQLLSHSADLASITLEDAEIAFLIDERGQANWGFPATKTPSALNLTVNNGSLRYFDARNGQALAIPAVNATIAIDADGRTTVTGTTEIRGRLAKFDASHKSLARIHDDGSPLDLTFETHEISASFDGRIATAKVLSLDGPVTITSTAMRDAAHWAGLDVGEGTTFNSFGIDGALDSAGRAFAIHRANILVDQFPFSGDVVIDLRNDKPKLQAVLAAPSFKLDSFIPPVTAKAGDWGTTDLGFSALRAIDAEVTVETPALSYGKLKDIPARLVATLAGGKLATSIAVQPNQTGKLTLETSIDASVLPPLLTAALKSDAVDAAAFLPEIAGIGWMSGTGRLEATLTGAGSTQQEIIGSSKGTVKVSLQRGALNGFTLMTALRQVTQHIIEGWLATGDRQTKFSSLDAAFTLSDGIATVDSFVLDNEVLTLNSTGEIDLLRRAIDLRATLKLKSAAAASEFPVNIAVKGPWDTPRIYPDIDGILLDPKAGFEKLKSMGITSGN